ncbi:MAG: pyridoxamine 5'-phosphate oxidase family protein [Rhodospirillaceae bacterium]|nr:pyridoxamine 5'-phosphate oxidase family protein [Rhodospirillaceae bacterium]
MSETAPTPRTQVKRLPKRGRYDRATIDAILDAGLVCHVGYVVDGQPYVTPTAYWRDGEHVYWHGSSASRMLRTLQRGVPACLTVAHIDGLVLARAGFHHSINYRSVMVLGTARLVEERAQKVAALRAFVERLYPGRWAAVRPPTEQELKATTVLSMPLTEASAKIRTGPPIDDEEDYPLPCWAGVVGLRTVVAGREADPRLPPGIAAGPDLAAYVPGAELATLLARHAAQAQAAAAPGETAEAAP